MEATSTVRANGQTIYYEAHGDGPPLVLVMGIGYDSSLWGQQVPPLSKRFRTIIFDNRDVGRSSKAEAAYTIADMADDLAGLLGALEIPKAHVLGTSMGGMIAMELALRHPQLLSRLVLVNTGAATARTRFDPIRTWAWVKAHDHDGLEFAALQFHWLFSPAFLRNDAAVDQTLKALASNPNPVSPEAYARQAEAYLKHDALDRLPGITAPTLVVAAEQDRLTPPSIVKEVADAIPGARYHMITGAGASHAVPLERPDDFNRLVADFLAE
ncbi:MAG: alpha/beta fold hydrolase [Deltaproteobacteria bacterium]|nr:alpha/beta fold hydrolase [Deltaproteobacteria bacterium]